jgi:DNA polymerase (family 10)
MTNTEIASVFEQIADLLEFKNANPFRIRAYRNGARTIRDLGEPALAILADESRKLTDIKGIGKDLAEKCATLVETGKLPMLEDLQSEIPEGALAMLRIPGLGPKRAAVLFNELEVTSLGELKLACERGSIRALKGFGEKTEESILKGIAVAASADKRIYWQKADQVAQQLLEHLGECPSIENMEMAGSYRRRRETVGDLDVLVVSEDVADVMDRFAEFPQLTDTLARGDTKMSIRLRSGLQVDLRVVRKESFGAALQYFTGSKDHNVELRGRAKQRNLKINEYGVFRTDSDREEYIAGATEDEVYAALDLPVIPPELREARREFAAAEANDLPELIERDDIRGDLHMHTDATDGKHTLAKMCEAARARGLEYIAITDHSKRVTIANGLAADRLLAQWEDLDTLRKALPHGFHALKGIECDILESGELDLPDDVLEQADWVIVSVHFGQHQTSEQITARICGALANPHTHMLAHPTGRLINRRNPYAVDMEAVFAAAVEHGKMLELNANPARLDLNDVHLAAAKSHGIPIVISTDAHAADQLDLMRYGVLQARRGGLTKDDVANTLPWQKFRMLLNRKP